VPIALTPQLQKAIALWLVSYSKACKKRVNLEAASCGTDLLYLLYFIGRGRKWLVLVWESSKK